MLETPQERIKLLRAGLTGKAIEELYIKGNNFKLVRFPVISRDHKSIIHGVKAEFDAET